MSGACLRCGFDGEPGQYFVVTVIDDREISSTGPFADLPEADKFAAQRRQHLRERFATFIEALRADLTRLG